MNKQTNQQHCTLLTTECLLVVGLLGLVKYPVEIDLSACCSDCFSICTASEKSDRFINSEPFFTLSVSDMLPTRVEISSLLVEMVSRPPRPVELRVDCDRFSIFLRDLCVFVCVCVCVVVRFLFLGTFSNGYIRVIHKLYNPPMVHVGKSCSLYDVYYVIQHL
jgi:hypothetical protein